MSQPLLFGQKSHSAKRKRGKMEIIRDAPWIKEAETVGYPVGDGTLDDEEDEDEETFREF